MYVYEINWEESSIKTIEELNILLSRICKKEDCLQIISKNSFKIKRKLNLIQKNALKNNIEFIEKLYY